MLSAGVVVVRRDDGVPRYLLLRAYRNWDFPKGVVEPGEDPLAAAVREVREETTIDDLVFRWGHGYRQTEPYGRNKTARLYLAESPASGVSLPVNPELGAPEHHEFRWLRREDAREKLPGRLAPILDWAHRTVTGGIAGD